MFTWHDEWLESSPEVVLEPDLPIVDPHHHYWAHDGMSRYVLEDLQADAGAGHNVESTVFIECLWGYRTDGPKAMQPVGETDTMAKVAERSASTGAEIKGLVGYADLNLGDAVQDVLEAHIQAGRGRFRGIRHCTAYDPDPAVAPTHTRPRPLMMNEPDYVAGVRRVGALGLSIDAWLFHPQIVELTQLARTVPECTFVLDHLGGVLGLGSYAGRRSEVLEQWRRDIADIATCPNVVIKLGGIGMTVLGLGYENGALPPSSDDLVSDWGDPIRFAIGQFGVNRCMFESNFPVDKVSVSYVTLWNAFKKISAGSSDAEKAALFHDTATAVYRL